MPQVVIGIVISIAISIALNVVLSLLFPKASPQRPPQVNQPTPPKPEDGRYAQKQTTPSLSVALGRVKKAGDYAFLEEKSGTANHILVMTGHRIEGYVQHYLHDEPVTLNGSGVVTAPTHFDSKVKLTTRLGAAASTAYAALVSTFSSIWTNDHRGDGLATVLMEVQSVAQDRYLNVFPQQMPQHSAILDGALVYDPRDDDHDPDDPATWAFSQNLALLRLFHLTHPSGGKLSLADMYLPDWAHAADVCDQTVLNRNGDPEPRYAGGFWYRYSNDPVEVGHVLDQAAELVIYERPDGLIGVHAGELVTPDIRVTEDEILEISYDANRRAASTVLAVRGRWTDPENLYNTVDAAVYGDPYEVGDATQRTRTVDNAAVQRHNHIQRLQALAFIRANAARVSLTIPYDAESASRLVAYRRFVTVHYPSRGLDEAIVEITGRPKLSLRNLTLSFEGIVVPATLYAFVAATQEGAPAPVVDSVTPTGIPTPTGFGVAIASETLSGGQSAAYGLAGWSHVSDALSYELEFQLDDLSDVPRSVLSKPGEDEVRTPPLQDGALYRFRLRTWSGGANSDWTGYLAATATADSSAPGQPDNFNSSKAGSDVTLTWDNPNSPNLYRTVLYRGTTAVFGSAAQIYVAYGGIGAARSYEDPGLAAGTYYWWVRSFNASGVGSTQVGPETETI